MADEEPTQLVLMEEEKEIIHTIRKYTNRNKVPKEDTEENIRLRCTVELAAYVGDRHLGLYFADGTSLITSCAKVGVEIQERMLDDRADVQAEDGLDVEDEQGLSTDSAPAQVTNEEIFDESIPWEWDEVRVGLIPSYIQNITFAVSKADLNDERRKELEERFPGVTIQEASPLLSGPNRSNKRQAAPEQPFEKPTGVKTAIFELDTSNDPTLEGKIRRQYPWATIKLTVAPTAQRSLSDIETHLQDFAAYMTEYPPDTEFNGRLDRTLPWNALPLHRKLSIAHARAIEHGRCGETRNPSASCENCKQNGYTCRVYRSDFVSNVALTSHIALEDGCQHCRLLDVKCDIPPYQAKSATAPPANSLNSTKSTNAARADLSSEATVVTPLASRKLNLANRTTRETPASNLANTALTNQADIKQLGRQLGLDLTSPDVLWVMYRQWKDSGAFCPFNTDTMGYLQHFYTNLVNLYIVATAIKNRALAYAALLEFQATIFEQRDTLPDVEMSVIRAFRYLPENSKLCQWIVIVFAHAWNTVEAGDYNNFLKMYKELDPKALSKFLYGVAYERDRQMQKARHKEGDPHNKSGIKEVLDRFCSVHDHTLNSEEDRRCTPVERRCKYLVLKSLNSSPNKAASKRTFEGSSGGKNNKKFKRNDGHQGSCLDSRGCTKELVVRHDDFDYLNDDTDSESEINIGRQSLRNAEGRKQSSNEARNPKPLMRGAMASLFSDDHLASLEESEFDPSSFLDDHPRYSESTVAAQAPETPQGDVARSEEPTSERRSARASAKSLPPGFFQLHLPKKYFENTMWNGFKN